MSRPLAARAAPPPARAPARRLGARPCPRPRRADPARAFPRPVAAAVVPPAPPSARTPRRAPGRARWTTTTTARPRPRDRRASPRPSSAATAPPPLLVFVNGKSGGRRGERLKTALACAPDLDALDVVDLGAARGPEAALRAHGHVEGLRILVCGGDGTVAWVLQALEDLEEVRETPGRADPSRQPPPPRASKRAVPRGSVLPATPRDFSRTFGDPFPEIPFANNSQKLSKLSSSVGSQHPLLLKQPPPPPLHPQLHPKPPVGILPLGTGNDLARVFGWGARYDDALVAAPSAPAGQGRDETARPLGRPRHLGTRRRGDDVYDASTRRILRTEFERNSTRPTTPRPPRRTPRRTGVTPTPRRPARLHLLPRRIGIRRVRVFVFHLHLHFFFLRGVSQLPRRGRGRVRGAHVPPRPRPRALDVRLRGDEQDPVRRSARRTSCRTAAGACSPTTCGLPPTGASSSFPSTPRG